MAYSRSVRKGKGKRSYGSRKYAKLGISALSAAADYGIRKYLTPRSNTSTAVKYRKGQRNASTQTETRRKRVVRRAGYKNGGCATGFNHIRPMNKWVKSLLVSAQPQEFINTFYGIYTSVSGLQYAFQYDSAYTNADLNSVAADYSISYPSGADLSSKYYILNIDVKTSWTNNGLMPIELVLFTCKTKETEQENPITLWNRGVAYQGDKSTSAVGAGAISEFYKETPHRQVDFNRHFWIVQWKTLILAPGEVHTHTNRIHHPRGIQESDFTSDETSDINPGSESVSNNYIRGYSMSFCGIVRGFPAALNTAAVGQPPVASTTISTIAPASVIYASEKRIRYKVATPTTKSFRRAYNLQVGARVVTESDETLQEVRVD